MRNNFVLGRHYELQDGVYILCKDVALKTAIRVNHPIIRWRFPKVSVYAPDNHLIYRLTPEGMLVIYRGYAWNGPTMAAKSPERLYPSLVHDAFCQMYREGEISFAQRRQADAEYVRLLKESGSWWITQKIHGAGVFIGSWHARLTQ